MYKSDNKLQSSFLDFNQPMGLHMNPENRWIRMADMIPWDVFEKKYKHLFKSKTGNVAKPLRMALGALIIQTRFQFSDRELVQQITENPYLQYFIGLPGYQETSPFDASTLVLFRKRISAKMLMEANEYLLQENNPEKKEDDNDHHNPPSGNGSDDSGKTEETENKGTLTIDATCAPVYIRYPQDVSLLNEAREKLEEMIFWFHKAYGVALPRRDCKAARKQYLSFAKSKKHSAKQIRKALKKQLSYVKRNIGYLEGFMSAGLSPRQKDIPTILTIFKLYEQQQYMYDNKVHKVENRIVELSRKVESKSARIFRLRRIAALSTTLHPASAESRAALAVAEPYTLDTAEARCYPISGGVDHGSLQILPAVHQRRKSVIDVCDPS